MLLCFHFPNILSMTMKKALARGLEERCPFKDGLGFMILQWPLNCSLVKHKVLHMTLCLSGI